MIEIVTTQPTPESGREPLFSIDGTAYTIPMEVPASLALEAMEITRQRGEASATAWVMEQLLGAEGWKALRTCPQVRKADMRVLMRICRERVFGGMEEEGKG